MKSSNYFKFGAPVAFILFLFFIAVSYVLFTARDISARSYAIKSPLRAAHTLVSVGPSGEHSVEGSARVLSSTGEQLILEYAATVKSNVLILTEFAAMSVGCSPEELTAHFASEAASEAFAARVAAGVYLHGPRSYVCETNSVGHPRAFYRESLALPRVSGSSVTVSTRDTDPADLFLGGSVALDSVPMASADWDAVASHPAAQPSWSALAAEAAWGSTEPTIVEETRAFATLAAAFPASVGATGHAHAGLSSPLHLAAPKAGSRAAARTQSLKAQVRARHSAFSAYRLNAASLRGAAGDGSFAPLAATEEQALAAAPWAVPEASAVGRARLAAAKKRASVSASALYQTNMHALGRIASGADSPVVSAVFMAAEDAQSFAPGANLPLNITATGLTDAHSVKVRVFRDEATFDRTEETLVWAGLLPYSDLVWVPIKDDWAGSDKLYADVCFYFDPPVNGSLPAAEALIADGEDGFSCANAAAVRPMCSLDDPLCQDDATPEKLFVVPTGSPRFTLLDPAGGAVRVPDTAFSLRFRHGHDGTDSVRVKLMRFRLLALKDQEVQRWGVDVDGKKAYKLDVNPVGGSMYPYYVQIEYDCDKVVGVRVCKKWKSPYFSVPREFAATWNYDEATKGSLESVSLLDSSCSTLTCSPKPSSFFSRAQCGLCDAGVDISTTLICADCFVRGSVGVGGVRLDLSSTSRDRFQAVVTGALTARMALKGSVKLSLAGEAEVAQLGYRFGGFEVSVAGIDFDLDFLLGVRVSVEYSAAARGQIGVVGTITQPAFTTLVRYGDSLGDTFSSSVAAEVSADISLSGEASVALIIAPTVSLELERIIDTGIRVPLFVQADLEASTVGYPALPEPSPAPSPAPTPDPEDQDTPDHTPHVDPADPTGAAHAAARAAAWRALGDCSTPHRLRYRVNAGVREVRVEAHAKAYPLRKWTKGDWVWSVWQGDEFPLAQGCAFAVTNELPWTRLAFARVWDWEVPVSFDLPEDVAAFLDTVSAELAALVQTDVGRVVLELADTYTVESDSKKKKSKLMDSILSRALASGSPAAVNSDPRAVVLDISFSPHDSDSSGPSADSRSAADLASALGLALSQSTPASPGVAAAVVCAPATSCGRCTTATVAGVSCAFCPSTGRCEPARAAAGSGSSGGACPSAGSRLDSARACKRAGFEDDVTDALPALGLPSWAIAVITVVCVLAALAAAAAVGVCMYRRKKGSSSSSESTAGTNGAGQEMAAYHPRSSSVYATSTIAPSPRAAVTAAVTAGEPMLVRHPEASQASGDNGAGTYVAPLPMHVPAPAAPAPPRALSTSPSDRNADTPPVLLPRPVVVPVLSVRGSAVSPAPTLVPPPVPTPAPAVVPAPAPARVTSVPVISERGSAPEATRPVPPPPPPLPQSQSQLDNDSNAPRASTVGGLKPPTAALPRAGTWLNVGQQIIPVPADARKNLKPVDGRK